MDIKYPPSREPTPDVPGGAGTSDNAVLNQNIAARIAARAANELNICSVIEAFFVSSDHEEVGVGLFFCNHRLHIKSDITSVRSNFLDRLQRNPSWRRPGRGFFAFRAGLAECVSGLNDP
jgi:hypothetical protein